MLTVINAVLGCKNARVFGSGCQGSCRRARYFAALSVDLTNQLTQLVSTSDGGKTGLVHPDSTTEQMAQWTKKAAEIESRYLLELD